MSCRLRERRSTRFGELSTANDTSYTSEIKTVTNMIKQPNTKYSTKDRQALKKLIIALGNKYAETIVLHRKASMEVGKLKLQKKEQEKRIQKLKTLQKSIRMEETFTIDHIRIPSEVVSKKSNILSMQLKRIFRRLGKSKNPRKKIWKRLRLIGSLKPCALEKHTMRTANGNGVID
ncbi:unnamed protein product [Caenorhabditis nigoni]|uniref:Uncharacterized protein n=1 Tax=Caenorhabditis nigoni TaxID=1611254 RepID=A0A2G5SCA3_9PELO|nr:hypothetical protein B9Z55_028227 [Caenorhabditis nigoni]